MQIHQCNSDMFYSIQHQENINQMKHYEQRDYNHQ